MNNTQKFLQHIKTDIVTAIEEANEYEEMPPTGPAQKACFMLAEIIAPFFGSDLMYSVFLEDAGGLSLIMQSLKANRRVNYNINSDGANITIVTVDENMDTEVHNTNLASMNYWSHLVKWVCAK